MLAKLVRPHHLKLFFSNRFVHASIIAKQNNACVASASTNNATFRKLLGIYAPKNDEAACEQVARVLATKAAAKKVTSLFWDGVVSQKTTRKKFRPAADRLWQALEREAPQLRLIRRDEGEDAEEDEAQAEGDPVSVKALTRKSRVDPGFRQEMWRLLNERHLERTGQGSAA